MRISIGHSLLPLLLLILLVAPTSRADIDQYWTSYFLTKKWSESSLVFDYSHRDYYAPFRDNILNQYRLTYTKRGEIVDWSLGYGHQDVEAGDYESRLFQMLTIPFVLGQTARATYRLGMEERFFQGDSNIYLRFRMRLQVFVPLFENWEFLLSNELFYLPEGFQRYATGFIENRAGVGLRVALTPRHYVDGLFTRGYQRTLKLTNESNWLLLSTGYSF